MLKSHSGSAAPVGGTARQLGLWCRPAAASDHSALSSLRSLRLTSSDQTQIATMRLLSGLIRFSKKKGFGRDFALRPALTPHDSSNARKERRDSNAVVLHGPAAHTPQFKKTTDRGNIYKE